MKPVAVNLSMTKGADNVQIPWTGYVIVPGLAVCKTPRGVGGQWVPAYRRWHVVHVPSGWRVGTDVLDFASRTAATAVAVELGKLADWTQSAKELQAVGGLREQVRDVFFGRGE